MAAAGTASATLARRSGRGTTGATPARRRRSRASLDSPPPLGVGRGSRRSSNPGRPPHGPARAGGRCSAGCRRLGGRGPGTSRGTTHVLSLGGGPPWPRWPRPRRARPVGALLRAARPHRSRRWSMPLSPALLWRQCGPGFGGCGRRSPGRPHRRCLGTFWVWGPPPGCRRIPTCTGYGCCFAWPCCMPSGCCGAPATVCARTGLSLGLPTLLRPPVSRSTRACVLTGRTWGWRAGGRTPRVLPWIPPSRQRSPRFGSAGVSAGCLPRCTRGLRGLLLPLALAPERYGPGAAAVPLGAAPDAAPAMVSTP
jgi:hypothetical protein